MEYTLITLQDKLAIAQDTLRSRESEHYRYSILPPAEYGGQERLEQINDSIEDLQAVVKELEEEVTESHASEPSPDILPTVPVEDEE